jgi:hypothetical protein
MAITFRKFLRCGKSLSAEVIKVNEGVYAQSSLASSYSNLHTVANLTILLAFAPWFNLLP